MTHLWQRFLLASSLIAGLAIGVAATVFGYSNLSTVDLHWSVLHLDGVPLWTVAVVPIALILVAGTIYHWIDGLHHFTEHMRHRHRVRDLEAEVARLRAHLDQVLEMPRGDRTAMPAELTAAETPSLPPAQPEPAAESADTMTGLEAQSQEPAAAEAASSHTHEDEKRERRRPSLDRRKRVKLIMEPQPDSTDAPVHANGVDAEPVVSPKEE